MPIKAAGEKAMADFLLKMAGGGKKQPDNEEDAVANAVANALANMVGAEGYGEGSADAILECRKRRPAFEQTWLLNMLKKVGWCILQKDGGSCC